MERGATSDFHGYAKTSQTSSGMKLPEINTTANLHSTTTTADENECIVREQDRLMPIANVIRIMRKILPSHAKISDDAKETIQDCVSEFISFVTGEANERCQREQRKTITAEDVLWAMSKLGFDDYIEPLTLYLNRYREFEGDRGSIRGEPSVKRTVVDSSGALSLATFPPVFQLAHHRGFFEAPTMGGGYPKENTDAGSSYAAMNNIEPINYGQCNK